MRQAARRAIAFSASDGLALAAEVGEVQRQYVAEAARP
jgi:hypothetical protein